MLKVPSFGMNTCPETFVPLMDYTLSLDMPDLCRTLLQFTDVIIVMNLMSVVNVSIGLHPCQRIL